MVWLGYKIACKAPACLFSTHPGPCGECFQVQSVLPNVNDPAVVYTCTAARRHDFYLGGFVAAGRLTAGQSPRASQFAPSPTYGGRKRPVTRAKAETRRRPRRGRPS
ncbi:unnamed protein product, partial [Heterosigma akashiwo]